MATAVSFAVFQINIPLLGGIHLNLTPLVGILLGPALGAVAIFVVNIFSAAIGHGGWGLIGANSIINSVEVFLGYESFRMLKKRLGIFSSGVLAAITALAVGSLVMIGIIAISGIQGSTLTMTEIVSNLILLAGVNIFVAVIEGIVTGFTLTYINRLRPDLLTTSKS
jgi:cobalt/nickel transport system permease protein